MGERKMEECILRNYPANNYIKWLHNLVRNKKKNSNKRCNNNRFNNNRCNNSRCNNNRCNNNRCSNNRCNNNRCSNNLNMYNNKNLCKKKIVNSRRRVEYTFMDRMNMKKGRDY